MKKKSIGIVLAVAAIASGVGAIANAKHNQAPRRTDQNEYRRGGLLGGGGFLGTGIGRSDNDYYSKNPGLIGGVGQVVEGSANTAANIVSLGAVSRAERRKARREENRRNNDVNNNGSYSRRNN